MKAMMSEPDYDMIDGVGFADPGGRSALRAATKRNPRNLPCPTCGRPDRLTALDKRRGYQCDSCADRAEGARRRVLDLDQSGTATPRRLAWT